MDPNTGHIFEIPESDLLERLKGLKEEYRGEQFDRMPADGTPGLADFNRATDSVKAFLATLPDSRAKSLALTKLDECVLWTTQAMGNRAQRRGNP